MSLGRLRLLAAGMAALALPTTAAAHHAFNMFALDKLVTVQGTVKDYQFKMPHVWVYMVLPGKDGAPEDWGFEAHSPNLVARKGWKTSTLAPGDKITVVMHPMKDGSRAGSVVRVILADGRVLWNAESDTRP